MNKTTQNKQRFEAWRARLDKKEAKISKLIFEMRLQEKKLWDTCPHQWGYNINENEKTYAFGHMLDENWNQCIVCKGLAIKK